jgi:arylsulfatase A-like enzyme
VKLITGRRIDQAWDTHRDHFPLLKKSLCPPFDRAISALLEDMQLRGLLDETLVVLMGEFGRTPKLGYITSGAGAEKNGRDHWPYCYTVMFAGAGIAAGAIHGASDKQGGYPSREPVTPEDVCATIYEALGVPAETQIRDALNRPHHLILGQPIRTVLA